MVGAVSLAVLAMGSPAFADSNDDLLSGFDGNAPLISNISVAPVQLCGVMVGDANQPVDQKTGACTNTPVGDPYQQLITNSKLIGG